MIKHIIQVSIIDDSGLPKCEAYCGVDWSSEETIALARQRIKERFSDQVRLQYTDLSKPTANHGALAEWSQTIRNKSLSSPLLLINGEPRISGEFDIRQLLDAIEAELEIEA